MKTEVKKELLFEIVGEGGGWDIYRITYSDSTVCFTQVSVGSVFDAEDLEMTQDEFEVFMEKLRAPVYFESFESFWNEFTVSDSSFTLHFINIHPEYKEFIENSVNAGRQRFEEKQRKERM